MKGARASSDVPRDGAHGNGSVDSALAETVGSWIRQLCYLSVVSDKSPCAETHACLSKSFDARSRATTRVARLAMAPTAMVLVFADSASAEAVGLWIRRLCYLFVISDKSPDSSRIREA